MIRCKSLDVCFKLKHSTHRSDRACAKPLEGEVVLCLLVESTGLLGYLLIARNKNMSDLFEKNRAGCETSSTARTTVLRRGVPVVT